MANRAQELSRRASRRPSGDTSRGSATCLNCHVPIVLCHCQKSSAERATCARCDLLRDSLQAANVAHSDLEAQRQSALQRITALERGCADELSMRERALGEKTEAACRGEKEAREHAKASEKREAKSLRECETLSAQLRTAAGWHKLVAEAESRAADKEREASALRAELVDARRAMREVREVREAAEDIRYERIAASEELQRARDELSACQAERNAQTQQVRQLAAGGTASQYEAAQMKERYAALEAEVGRMRAEAKRARNDPRYDEVVREKEQLRAALASAVEESSRVAREESEVPRLKRQVKDLSEQCDQLNSKLQHAERVRNLFAAVQNRTQELQDAAADVLQQVEKGKARRTAVVKTDVTSPSPSMSTLQPHRIVVPAPPASSKTHPLAPRTTPRTFEARDGVPARRPTRPLSARRKENARA